MLPGAFKEKGGSGRRTTFTILRFAILDNPYPDFSFRN
jgi:hypothetical protein